MKDCLGVFNIYLFIISFSMQSRLLRVIKEKEIRRIDVSKIIPINLRIISTTNKIVKNKRKDKRSEKIYFS
ncbi:sigma 54-interacting transcriptional regulator [Peribacillus frigoritolerans]|uniref:sigma 54-interacting transcriptional regulator n=1 Tax=Peribacillus frigoritolerans TaxID=450367 RepID=UPI0032B4DA4F